MRTTTGLSLGLTFLFLTGCGDSGKSLNAGGSTFVYPMMSKWIDEYKKATGASRSTTSRSAPAAVSSR